MRPRADTHELPPLLVLRVQGNEAWLVKLEDVNTPEAAAALRGARLLVRAMDRPPTGDADVFYVQDLVGLAVHHAKGGCRLGRVVDLHDGTGE